MTKKKPSTKSKLERVWNDEDWTAGFGALSPDRADRKRFRTSSKLLVRNDP
jgi:hypothetical protein